MELQAPHLAFPLRLEPDGSLAQREQDSTDDVRMNVHALLRTNRGSRPLSPDVGIDDPTFTAGVDPDVLATDLERQEPRANVSIATEYGEDGDQEVRVHVALADIPEDVSEAVT